MKKQVKEFVCLRFGDMGIYGKYDDLVSAIEDLKEMQVKGPCLWSPRGKLNTPEFEGDNYLSCFWGDKGINFVRDLSDDEKREVERGI